MTSKVPFIVQKNYAKNIVTIMLLRLLLDINYVTILSPKYSYSGFTLDFQWGWYGISWFILIGSSVWVNHLYSKQKISSFILVLIYCIAFVPYTSLMGFKPMPVNMFLATLIYWVMMMFYQLVIPQFVIRSAEHKMKKLLFVLIAIMLSFIVLFIWARYTNFRIQLDIINVYGVRMEAREYNMSAILSYGRTIAVIAMPLYMLKAFSTNHKAVAVLLISIIFINFSITASKSIFYSLVLSIVVYKFWKNRFLKLIPQALVALVGFSMMFWLLIDNTFVNDVIIRRVMYVPAQLNYCYYDFFSQESVDMLRQSILRYIGYESTYIQPITHLIGAVYFNAPQMSANNGLFSDAYTNFGLWGCFFYPCLIIIALRVLEACSQGIPYRCMLSVVILVSINFISTSFFTVMLTHGFIACCVILYLWPGRNLPKSENTLK